MELRRFPSMAGGYPFAVGAVLLASLVILPLRQVLPPTAAMLLYVPVIITVARFTGAKGSALSAIVAFLVLDLLFVPPYYHLRVASLAEWLGLFVFLAVALISGQQTAALRDRERAALGRQRELEFLNRLSFRVASEKSLAPTAEFIAEEVTEILGAARVALYLGGSGPAGAECLAQAGDPKGSSGEAALVAWVMRTGAAIWPADPDGAPLGTGLQSVTPADAIPGVTAEGVYLPLKTAASLPGALHVRFDAERAATADDARLLVAVANLGASALERQLLEDSAARAAAQQEADRLKATLVSSVSHELKTPLAAATARITGLIDEAGTFDAPRVAAELATVAEDLRRLNGSIGDLLDLSRLESDAWRPHFERCEVADVLGTVLSHVPSAGRDRVRFDLPDRSPLVDADFAQLARAISHLVENALEYSPADQPVTVGVSGRGDVRIWVEDRGAGVPDAEKNAIFEKFFRGSASGTVPTGTGLGLAIACEIVRAHGGTLVAEDAQPHGARFVITLPAATEVGP